MSWIRLCWEGRGHDTKDEILQCEYDKEANSGTTRRNKGALPLVGESGLSRVMKTRPFFNTRSYTKQKSYFHHPIQNSASIQIKK